MIVGGAAAAIHYGIELGTHDIDTWTNVQEELARAVEQARAGTGLSLPFAKSGVADGPYDFESRLERALPHLQRLVVKVPEKHDLALMKVIRGYEHDLDGIDAIHKLAPLDLETLLQRYREEMGAVHSPPKVARSTARSSRQAVPGSSRRPGAPTVGGRPRSAWPTPFIMLPPTEAIATTDATHVLPRSQG